MSHPSGTAPSSTCVFTPPSLTATLDLSEMFDSARPLEVDVGCGKGRFLAARAASQRDANFIGMDHQLSRIRRTDRKLVRAGLNNARLLRVEASYALHWLIPGGSVRAYYILFPDPWPKRRHHRRRLFSPDFLDDMDRTLAPDGVMHAATDDADYFEAIGKLFAADARYAGTEPFLPTDEERTDFELLFTGKGKKVYRCSFRRADGSRPPSTRPANP